jgi:RimJ/RimL family protein N-acetyltransferase
LRECLPGDDLRYVRDVTEPAHLLPVLVAVDDAVLEQLVHAATTSASADEVTPPATVGGSWTPTRVRWLRNFHQERRAGLDGGAGEATWAVALDKDVIGSVRLKRTKERSVLEAGIWLTRGVRGRGLGRAVMVLVLEQALSLGAAEVHASTTPGNTAALNLLRSLNFTLTPAVDGREVHALISVAAPRPAAERR